MTPFLVLFVFQFLAWSWMLARSVLFYTWLWFASLCKQQQQAGQRLQSYALAIWFLFGVRQHGIWSPNTLLAIDRLSSWCTPVLEHLSLCHQGRKNCCLVRAWCGISHSAKKPLRSHLQLWLTQFDFHLSIKSSWFLSSDHYRTETSPEPPRQTATPGWRPSQWHALCTFPSTWVTTAPFPST